MQICRVYGGFISYDLYIVIIINQVDNVEFTHLQLFNYAVGLEIMRRKKYDGYNNNINKEQGSGLIAFAYSKIMTAEYKN